MRFRNTIPGDVEQVLAGSGKPYDKLPGPEETEEAITGLDHDGKPRIVVKAERVAELWLAIDHTWADPATRWNTIELAHAEMFTRLRGRGYWVGYCFFADGVANGYVRRLVAKGWNRIIERCVRFAVR